MIPRRFANAGAQIKNPQGLGSDPEDVARDVVLVRSPAPEGTKVVLFPLQRRDREGFTPSSLYLVGKKSSGI